MGGEGHHSPAGCVGVSGSGGSVVKNPPANAGDTSSIPGSGRSPGGHSNPLQYSCLENSVDREPGGLQSMSCKDVDLTEQLTLSLSFLRRKPFFSLAISVCLSTYLCIYLFIYSPSISPPLLFTCLLPLWYLKAPLAKEKIHHWACPLT